MDYNKKTIQELKNLLRAKGLATTGKKVDLVARLQSQPNIQSSVDYKSYKVVDLRKLLKERGLATSGLKYQLVERLIERDRKLKIPDTIPEEEENANSTEEPVGDIIAFYGQTGKYAPFSNWYPSRFIESECDPTSPTGAHDNIFYANEQYMMWRKAILFGDEEMADQILNAVDEKDFINYDYKLWKKKMAHIKALGRQVRNFKEDIWKDNREQIMRDGLMLKFTDNPVLADLLLSTDDKTLAEAAPRDRVWGTGTGMVGSLDRKNWKGLNLLGKSLEAVRDQLRGFKREL